MDRWKFVNEKWIPRPVSRGEGVVSGIPLSPSNLRPFGAPPSIGRRECPREPLPLEGAAERSEAELASFFAAKPPPLCLPHAGKALSVGIVFPHMHVFALTVREKRCSRITAFPIGEGGTRQRCSGALVCRLLETHSPTLFHTARTLSGSLRSPPAPRGEGCVSGIPLSPPNLRPFGAPPSIGRRECPHEPLPLEGAAERSEAGLASFFAAKPPPLCLPPAEKAVLSLCHHPQPALPLRGQAKEAQEASCASLIGMHFPAEIRCIYFLMSFRIAAEGKTALPEVFLFADVAFDRPAIEESTDIEK